MTDPSKQSSIAVGTLRDGKFAEAWWPGYVRQPLAMQVRWRLPERFGWWPGTVLGVTRDNRRGGIEIHLTHIARINPNGEITGSAYVSGDRWLSGGDALTIQFAAVPDDPAGKRG